jgi:RNA methyltransferase, TrmH family
MNGEPEKYLSSAENPLLKHVRKLFRDRAYRLKAGEFMIEGYRAFDSAASVKTVLLRGEARPPEEDLAGARILRIEERLFDKLAEDGPGQGVFGICALPPAGKLAKTGRYVCLDGLQDPGNVGTLIRVAAAFALDGLLFGRGSADPFSPKVVRSSAGAVFKVPLIPLGALEELRGYELIAADMAGVPLPEFKPPASFILVVGNEGSGVTPEFLAVCGSRLSVPMPGKVESLNAAIAAGIILYELTSSRS